jgi:uncharacterized protein
VTVLRRERDGYVLCCRIQPRARTNAFVEVRGEEILIRLTAPPVDGKANEALRRFVAEAFEVPLARVSIEAGEHGRHKRLRISGSAAIPAALTLLGIGNG